MQTFGSTAIWLTEIYASSCNILMQQRLHQEDPSFAFLQLLVLLLLFSIKKSKNYESTDYL